MPNLPRRRVDAVIRALRQRAATLDRAARILRESDLWPESLVLETPGVLSWAEKKVARGVVLTIVDDAYPTRWLGALGSSAPPALWRSGSLPAGESLTIVGSREAPHAAREFCFAAARHAASAGKVVWSGGAEGCDHAAEIGANEHFVALLPYGLRRAARSCGCRLSLCAPSEEFTPGAAMQRNSLLYAASTITLVGHARLREGASWHSAIDALRRHRRVAVFDDDSEAARALAALGAFPVRTIAELGAVPSRPLSQGALFKVG